MANGTTDYAIGEIRADIDNNKCAITEIKKEVKEIVKATKEQQTIIDKATGSLNAIKWVAMLIFGGLATNIAITIIFN